MPSPFPGMDPYLEGRYWSSLHHVLATEIVRQLTPRLGPRYIAVPDTHFVVEDWDRPADRSSDTYPDVAVQTWDVAEAGTAWTTAVTGMDPAELGSTDPDLRAPLVMEAVIPPQVPHSRIEVRETAGDRLVTAIEILSPSNKREASRSEYLTRRHRILLAGAHLLEIDLLRRGKRVPMKEKLPPAAYFVFLTRAESGLLTEIWPIALDEPLPTVPVPLLAGDDDVALDLQSAFSSTYDDVRYDRRIDYSRPPEVPLTPTQAAWAHDLLTPNG